MIRVGTSGWSYPSWRPGFYPDGMQPADFLRFYAERFDTVELNTTGYRLPSEDQFRRWADAVPDGFRFAVKLPLTRLDRVTPFLERVVALGDRLGPSGWSSRAPATTGSSPSSKARFPARSSSRGTSGTSRGMTEATGSSGSTTVVPSRTATSRLREPPYSDAELEAAAAGVRDPAYVYLRHEDEPTAPVYAEKLRAFLRQ